MTGRSVCVVAAGVGATLSIGATFWSSMCRGTHEHREAFDVSGNDLRPVRPGGLSRVFPQVVLPNAAAAEFAGRSARQRLAELHAPRVLEFRQARPAVREEFGGEGVTGLGVLGRFDERDGALPPVLVRDADDDDVADRRMLQQGRLDLGRVDVHPAGDDQIGAAVAHVEPAVLVEVAEVAGV